jgi:hypothetical protein
MDEPWQIYYEELLERIDGIEEQRFNRAEDVAEGAHETYQATADRLTNQLDYAEGDALDLTRSFGRAVEAWIEDGSFDVDQLAEMLEERQIEWDEEARVAG